METFHPSASHYRRRHAPNRRYLPDELSITILHSDFIAKYLKYSTTKYDTYRKEFQNLNITICKLEHEECEECEKADQHEHGHSRNNLISDCADCMSWKIHIKRASLARELYNFHSIIAESCEDTAFYSAHMERVIMMPNLETFKQAIFTRRISTFNETFASIGTFANKNIPIIAPIWHKGISGRKQEQLISAYHKFFLVIRDQENVVLWLKNCSSQNKNWCLFSYLVYIINSKLVSINCIDIYFFEAGHTYTSADSFHHAVERNMKGKKNLYTFADFHDCVATALPYVKALKMTLTCFKEWKSYKCPKKMEARE